MDGIPVETMSWQWVSEEDGEENRWWRLRVVKLSASLLVASLLHHNVYMLVDPPKSVLQL
jgi:hypothetical protein